VEDQLVNALEAKEQTSRELVQVMEEREQAFTGAKDEIRKLLGEANSTTTELELVKETMAKQVAQLTGQQKKAAEDEELLQGLRQQLTQTQEQLRSELQRDSPEYVLQLRRGLSETKKALTMAEATVHALHKEMVANNGSRVQHQQHQQHQQQQQQQQNDAQTPSAHRNTHHDMHRSITKSTKPNQSSANKGGTQGGKSGFKSNVLKGLRQRRQHAASSASVSDTSVNMSLRSNLSRSPREEAGLAGQRINSHQIMHQAQEAGALAGKLAQQFS
jgi:hypothetical protein